MSIEALIFDVDGTLADTEEAHRVAFNLAFERHRLDWSWSRSDYRTLLETHGGKERINAHIARLELAPADRKRLVGLVPDLHAEKTKFYSSLVGDGAVPLRPGIERLIDEAIEGGCKLAIASTTTAVNVDALLQATLGTRGLGLFSVIACGDQVRNKKPAPDIFHLALEHTGVSADRAIAFEDSAFGLQAALAAGLWTVVTPTQWTESADLSRAGLLLPHLGDPDNPIDGEPGGQLRSAAWLTYDELLRIAAASQAGGRAGTLRSEAAP